MKWKLSLLTLLGFYIVGSLAPDQRPVSRASQISVTTTSSETAPADDLSIFSPSFLGEWGRNGYRSEISPREAIEIALRRGEEIKAARDAGKDPEPLEAVQATVMDIPSAPDTPETASDAWHVTADRVNLRGGPGTDNPVVGSAISGDTLVPVSDVDRTWIEVQRPSGETAWIYASFLARSEG